MNSKFIATLVKIAYIPVVERIIELGIILMFLFTCWVLLVAFS